MTADEQRFRGDAAGNVDVSAHHQEVRRPLRVLHAEHSSLVNLNRFKIV